MTTLTFDNQPQAPHNAGGSLLINQAKFIPPIANRGSVLRQRLLLHVEHQNATRLILLQATAGFGKTTFMVQWLERIQQQGQHVTWLTLDAADNDPARLMGCLFGGLREWMTAVLGMREVSEFAGTDWMHLLDRIDPAAPCLTFFIDEFNHLIATETLKVVQVLLDRLPHMVRLVVGCRHTPALYLERFRVQGELQVLDVDAFRFDADEARQFFQARTTETLANWVVEKMLAITDGWPAALQFAVLATRKDGDFTRITNALSSNPRNLAGYLLEEVLNAQGQEIKKFLLQTCHFPILCAALCDAATVRSDSRHILQLLEQNGVFIMRVGKGEQWYRYHPLFAEFLQAEVSTTLPHAGALTTYSRAAHWFFDAGMLIEAVDLWLLAGNREAAVGAMSGSARKMVLQGQFATIVGWVNALEEVRLDAAGPELLLAAAWACTFCGLPELAEHWIERLHAKLEFQSKHGGMKDANAKLRDELCAIKASMLLQGGSCRSALKIAMENWERLSARDYFTVGAVANVISYCLTLEGEFVLARGFINRALLCYQKIDSALGIGYALAISGVNEAMQGNLFQALQQFREVRKNTPHKMYRSRFDDTHVNIVSVGPVAHILYEQDRLDEADELLQRYLPFVMHQPSIDMLLLNHIVRARIKLVQDDSEGALDILREADHNITTSRWQFSRSHQIIEWERIHIDLFTKRKERALARVESLQSSVPKDNIEFGHFYVDELFGCGIEFARCAIASGQVAQALVRLADEIAQAKTSGRRWRLLKLQLLRALAWDAHGDKQAAQTELLQSLQLGWQIGARRSFLDEGQRLSTLLAEVRPIMFSQLPDSEAVIRYWMSLRGELPAPTTVQLNEQNEILSLRELSILKLLAKGERNEQIAGHLFLSVHTIKWHIRHILEKFGARNRTEAVLIGRQLGLIG